MKRLWLIPPPRRGRYGRQLRLSRQPQEQGASWQTCTDQQGRVGRFVPYFFE